MEESNLDKKTSNESPVNDVDEQSSTKEVNEASPSAPPAFAMPTFPEGGSKAWLVVLGSAIVNGCSFGYVATFGVYEAYYQVNQLRDKDPSDIAWIGSMQVFFLFAGGLFAGALFDLYGAKVILIPATLTFVFSIMMTSLCTQYWHFILAQGVLGGFALGFQFTPSLIVVSHYFRQKRGAAIGLVAAGSSIGGIIFPIALNNAFNSHLGFGWGVRTVGFVVLALLMLACALVKERLPSRKGALFIPRAFLQPSFTFLTVGIFLVFWGFFVPFFYAAEYGIEALRMSPHLAFYLFSILNGASLPGRIIPGILADRFGRLNLLTFCVTAIAIVLFCWVQAKSNATLIVWTVFFGFFSGSVVTLYAACLAQITPQPQMIGTYTGMAMGVISFAGLTGPPIAGAIIKKYGFEEASIFSGAVALAGAAFVGASRLAFNRKLLTAV